MFQAKENMEVGIADMYTEDIEVRISSGEPWQGPFWIHTSLIDVQNTILALRSLLIYATFFVSLFWVELTSVV